MSNLLISSCGGKVPLMLEAQKALSRIFPSGKVVAGDSSSHVVSRVAGFDFWLMPPACDDNRQELIAGCLERGISSILPTRDGELEFWARSSQALSEFGISVITSQESGVSRALDKFSLAIFLEQKGFSTIPTYLSPSELGEGAIVVKERFGAGSKNLHFAKNKAIASRVGALLAEPVFQPQIAGVEVSVDAWLNRNSQVTGLVLRTRDLVIGGESVSTTTFRDSFLEEKSEQCLNSLDLRGPVNMQGFLQGNDFLIFDVNPRFGGSSTAGIRAGLDSIYWSLCEIYRPTLTPRFTRAEGEFRQVRIPMDVVIDDSDI